MSHRIVAASTTFQAPIVVTDVPDCLKLSDIVRLLIEQHGLPSRFLFAGMITIDGMPVPRQNWRLVRPKGGRELHFYISPAGGGGGNSGKNILGAVAAVFLTVATAGIASAGLPFLGIAGGTTAAQLAAVGVGIVGKLAINALFPPPAAAQEEQAAQANNGSLAGNVLSQGHVIPRVAGTLRYAPPLLAHPHTYQVGDDIYVEAVFAMAGAHQWSDPQAGGVPIGDLNGIEIWYDDGTAPARTNQFSHQTYPVRFNTELDDHDIRMGQSGYNDRELVDQETPTNSLPQWKSFVTRENCAFADVNLVFANLHDTGASGQKQVIWLRLRGRKKGETEWKNIQTFPYVGKGTGTFRRRIRLYFGEDPGNLAANAKTENAFLQPEDLEPVTENHIQFLSTDTDRFPAAYAYSFIRQVEGIDVWLNDAYFLAADQAYQFEIQRSEMVEYNDLYDVVQMQGEDGGPGDYRDYFDARPNGSGNWETQENIDDQGEVVLLDSVVCAWEEPPIPVLAPISTAQVRVKNQQIEQISFLLSGLVPDLSDGEWTGQVVTSNPAPHYRYVQCGDMTAQAVEEQYSDDDELADWRAECATQGYECNMVLDGTTVADALDSIASCGRARRSVGLKYGVIYHRDTTGETPTQHFSARNISDLSWSSAYSERPIAMSVRFLNKDKNYEPDERLVYDPDPVLGATTEIESVTYPGLVTEAEIDSRVAFDYGQLSNGLRWQFRIAIEQLCTMPGELAKLSHDALHRHAAYGRIVSIDSATTFTVDADIGPDETDDVFSVDDIFAVDDVFVLGEDWGCDVRTNGQGVITKTISAWDAEARRVTVDDTSGFEVGNMVVSGPVGKYTKRIQVLRIDPQEGLHMAVVTAQNETAEAAA